MVHKDIEWVSELETGIKLIDWQHREFIELVNRLLDSSMRNVDRRLLADSFKFLNCYICEHFYLEEAAMLEYSYPHYTMHHISHNSFREEINGLEMSLKADGNTHDLAIKLNYLTVSWVMNHVKVEDKNLIRHLLKQTSESKEILDDKLDEIVGDFIRRTPTHFSPEPDS